MEIFKRLSELGYKHYLPLTIEELDELDTKSIEISIESNLAFDWFREKYNLHYGIRNDGTHNSWYLSRWGKRYGTYEEARQACLEKLIELVYEN